eukprot:CAMPEP_0113567780 /NCGR_PEP_ID=MMETSP0015_2-20120614/23469_1 /TAXON_ID=2838 /ORGANISM="Odontella" /LENGTH=38 /DNA_ID=CAMNT_0000470219 /DNA_START=51 /DNA_END=163 /DNA_ORIENTATION=+ /assembly_acc=CAM_ASM_000160
MPCRNSWLILDGGAKDSGAIERPSDRPHTTLRNRDPRG